MHETYNLKLRKIQFLSEKCQFAECMARRKLIGPFNPSVFNFPTHEKFKNKITLKQWGGEKSCCIAENSHSISQTCVIAVCCALEIVISASPYTSGQHPLSAYAIRIACTKARHSVAAKSATAQPAQALYSSA